METDQVLKDIVVQGTLLDFNTDIYTSILNRMKHSRDFSDPFAKLVASTFQLCDEGVIDPWNVDLKGFAKIFLTIIDESFDRFGMAGYLISQAWRILLEKTEYSILKRQKQEEEEVSEELIPEDEAEEQFTFEPRTIELAEPVKHKETRPVMLVELLESMRHAFRKERRVSQRREQKELLNVDAMEDIIFELHAEEPEREIDETYSRILSQSSDEFYLEELWGSSIEDHWSFLVYCLFLMREKKIRLSQDEYFGRILIERVSDPTTHMIDV